MVEKVYFQKQRNDDYIHRYIHRGLARTQTIPCATVELSSFGDKTTSFALVEYDVRHQGEVKEPYKNDWKDEHGDDEFIPDELVEKSFEITLTIACRKLKSKIYIPGQDLSEYIANFINYLRCGGEFMIYFDGSKYGKRNVRFKEVDEDATVHTGTVQMGDSTFNETVLTFKVTLHVNDPIYNVEFMDSFNPGETKFLQ